MIDKNLISYYKARADEYEQIYYRDIPLRRKEIDIEAERLRKLVTGKEVLEIACGTGYWTKIISETASSLIATDISKEMINEAKKKSYVTEPSFVHTDLYHLPFDKKVFDMVVLGFWFSHHPRQQYSQLCDLLCYSLKNDGLIWMIDNNPPAEGANIESVRKDEHGNNFKRRYLENGREFIILKNYFEKEELKDIFSVFFDVTSINYNTYYWSVVLERKSL